MTDRYQPRRFNDLPDPRPWGIMDTATNSFVAGFGDDAAFPTWAAALEGAGRLNAAWRRAHATEAVTEGGG